MAQLWSWKVCVFIVGVAVTLDVLLVRSPLVGFGVVAGMLAVWGLFWSRSKSLAVVIFACGLLNYSPVETGAFSRLYPGDIAIGVFLVTWLMREMPLSLRRLFQPDLINGPLVGMAVVTPLSMVWSRLFPDPSVAYSFPHSDVSWATTQISQLALLAVTICMPFAVAATIKNWKNVEGVVITMGIVVTLGTLLTTAALFFGFGGSFTILGATRAYWEQPWDSSMEPLSALLLPFLYSGVLFGRRSLSAYRVICVLFIVCLLGVVITFSRECWFLAFLELVLVSALWLRGRIAARIAAVLAFVMIGFLLSALLVPGAIGLVTRFYNPEEVYGLDRIYFYVTGLQLFMTHPFLGVGAGNYQFFDRIYAEVSAGGIAHNQFITVAAETGMPGLIALLWLLVAVLKIPRKFNLWEGRQGDPHYWVKAAGSVFVLALIAECLFREAFVVSAAAGGGTKAITSGIFAWILLGILFSVCNLSQTAAGTKT